MNSKELLAKQFHAHSETLCELLSSPSGELTPSDLFARSVLGTRMLAGTTSLMGMKHWSELCSTFEILLRRYEDNRFPWDERIADVTSEFIEKEEILVAAHAADAATELDSVISSEEMVALISELSVLEEECETMTPIAVQEVVEPVVTVDLDNGPDQEPASDGDDIADIESRPEPSAPADDGGPMPGVCEELRSSFGRLQARLSSDAWLTRAWESEDVEEIRRELNTIDFCVRSIEKVISDRGGDALPYPRSTLHTLGIALQDFAAELSRGPGRTLVVDLSGEEQTIDPRLFSTTVLVLQTMINDTFSRCSSDIVRIHVSAEESHGAIRWRLSDDGNNFISDSPLDHEDQLAFYPGLRGVINLLARHSGVLWVEPGNGPRSRFEFTLPVSDARDALLVWGSGGEAFAVRATQMCARLAANDDVIKNDHHGRWVDIDGSRVPLLGLDELYSDAPGHGDTIAVLGSIDKRIAFFVTGAGEQVEAKVFDGAVPPWQGAPPCVAQVDQRRLPLLDTDHVVDAYNSVTGTLSTDQISGGVSDEAPEVTPRQAASREDVPAPPEDIEESPRENGVEVVVVEQSESMRDALRGILSQRGIRSACVADVDEALRRIESERPRLIISEFRMPTMAAKRLVDALKSKGSTVPVLVTTSQTGKTAELLVEKLGASGYLSKPLSADDVASRVSGYLAEGIPS